jgi:hypothetical protein
MPDVFAWWAFLPLMWWGFFANRRRFGRRLMLLLVPAGMISVILALLIGNFGTIVRERPQVTVLLLPLVALGLDHVRPRARAAPPVPVRGGLAAVR